MAVRQTCSLTVNLPGLWIFSFPQSREELKNRTAIGLTSSAGAARDGGVGQSVIG